MTKASDNEFPSLLVKEGSAPTAPAAGDQRVYIDSADHKLKRKDSASAITVVEGLPDQGNATYLDFTVGSAPATPASGKLRLYALTGKHMYQKDDAGAATALDGAAGGAVATDTIWDTKGDMVAATGADAAVKVPVGTDGNPLLADSSVSSGVGYAGSSALWESMISAMSPVHWWKLDEASGNFASQVNALTLTAGGSVSYHQADPWGGTSAAQFNTGSGTSSGLGSIPTGANERTVLFLVKHGGTATSGNKNIVAYGTGNGDQYFMFQTQAVNNHSGSTFDLFNDAFSPTSGPVIVDAAWHLVALGIVNSRVMHMWIDGVLGSRVSNATINTTGGNFVLNADGANVTFADVAVFSSWLGLGKLERLWQVLRAVL